MLLPDLCHRITLPLARRRLQPRFLRIPSHVQVASEDLGCYILLLTLCWQLLMMSRPDFR